MQCIHRIKKVAVSLAHDALAELLDVRLLGDSLDQIHSQLRVEQVVVTYIFFATADAATTTGDTIASLKRVLDSVSRRNNNRFSAEATHACQALMWKAASSTSPDVTKQWCDLLAHCLFENAGQVNKDKIARLVFPWPLSNTN